MVSIHAPREGCDLRNSSVSTSLTRFNSRTPGGVRPTRALTARERQRFQFTHPGRGATDQSLSGRAYKDCFNSRTPGGVRLHHSQDTTKTIQMFQFTHPGRGATYVYRYFKSCGVVSIHAPREGCDLSLLALSLVTKCFNSRTPGGVRLSLAMLLVMLNMFQFTHPGRGATEPSPDNNNPVNVSIHAPREGCDVVEPEGGGGGVRVSIHAPREGCDELTCQQTWKRYLFQFTHPGRGAT